LARPLVSKSYFEPDDGTERVAERRPFLLVTGGRVPDEAETQRESES
jgi:hypothetical protein